MNELAMKAFDFIRGRKQDYQLTFSRNSPAAQRVLRDLAKFCRANETVYNPDEKMTYVLIGRNEVWKRVQDNLNLTAQDLYQISTGQQLNLKDDTQ